MEESCLPALSRLSQSIPCYNNTMRSALFNAIKLDQNLLWFCLITVTAFTVKRWVARRRQPISPWRYTTRITLVSQNVSRAKTNPADDVYRANALTTLIKCYSNSYKTAERSSVTPHKLRVGLYYKLHLKTHDTCDTLSEFLLYFDC